MEKIGFELSKLGHRVQRIHDKEIEVLSEIWKKLKNAEGSVYQLVTYHGEVPDLDGMPPDLLEETVSRSDFSEHFKERLRESSEKNKLYQELMAVRKNKEAFADTDHLNNYVLENAPFLSRDLKERLEELVRNLKRVAVHDRVALQAGQPRRYEHDSAEWKNVGPLLREIEQLIRQRLRYSEA